MCFCLTISNLNDFASVLVERVYKITNMTIPPFPSQDLAKLVLGYLAEEQLMTAYDEFLQASPYLDALHNEYDRIFMTSLKSILAEYRAVKIYVETCKPFLLRKKIFQCTNLLDIVKFLVNHVDINKLQLQEADKTCSEKHNKTAHLKAISCEMCTSLKLPTCICKSRGNKIQVSENPSSAEASLQTSVETTPLADLPGNLVTTKRKQVRVLDKDSTYYNTDGQSSDASVIESLTSIVTDNRSVQPKSDISAVTSVKGSDSSESKNKIEEFDSILQSVVSNHSAVSGSANVPNQKVSNASTFQDFASGVAGGESQNVNIPDSSTSESLSMQAPLAKDYYNDNVIGPPKCQLLLQVSHNKDIIDIQTSRDVPKYIQFQKNTDDQKAIKVLSDVKVTNKLKDKKKLLTTKNATSTPVMQTIYINGTPAFKHNPSLTSHTFTKDEIMAMPTLIVVPASGPSNNPTNTCQSTVTQISNAITNVSTSRSLGPLVIDVPQTPSIAIQPKSTNLPDLNLNNPSEESHLKHVDFSKNASVPKDVVTSGINDTPNVQPPLRKSSSTPRRTTHVRILDFTTPRRILHETNEEQVTSQTSDAPVEVLISSSPNLSIAETTVVNTNPPASHSAAIEEKDTCKAGDGSAKENTTMNSNQLKRSNWDADLRALVGENTGSSLVQRRKNKTQHTRKKKSIGKLSNGNPDENKSSKKANKKPRKSRKVVKEVVDPLSDKIPKPEVLIKPTINIISKDSVTTAKNDTSKENEVSKNGSNDMDDDCVETPEVDRLSLQNVIGARLNISDLLETPYKQALYDIQMGTPKFFAPDIPDEPLSDIKIMNIPTPRFLDTPKPVSATPSSYSSRPTDYSSGGSYYKPDDLDYMPLPDLRCTVSSSPREGNALDKSIENVKDDEKKSRPVRQCTKNVSYYRLANPSSKAKELCENVDAASSCSDSTVSIENANVQSSETPRDKSKFKTEAKKRNVSTQKRKPTPKEKSKKFIKMKPRQTPTKVTPNRNRKKVEISHNNSPNMHRRNRTSSKEKPNSTPLTVAAPTKSRRKSSTPRKLHCTKSFTSENSSHDSPETIANTKQNATRDTGPQDSDAEQIALRWSDDGSQDIKLKNVSKTDTNEGEDISQIQEYIQNTVPNKSRQDNVPGCLREDLIKRGFDLETAKKLERDLLDSPPPTSDLITNRLTAAVQVPDNKKDETVTTNVETNSNVPNNAQVVEDEIEEYEVEFATHECNEDSTNYFVFHHDDTKEVAQTSPITLRDKFSMEVCIDGGITMRLRATPFSYILDQDPLGVEEIDYSYKETQMAVDSISNIDRLYTPLKESIKAQCYEIFDSTLTSLDTPLKAHSPKRKECVTTVTEIVIEEKLGKDETESKKRKRSTGSDEAVADSKKTKYLLSSASIQNIDIESVLTKLHGP